MSFLAPAWLLLLMPVAGLVVAYVVLQRRRRHYAARFTNLELLSSVAPKRPGWRRHVSAAAAVVGLAAMVVALARPVRQEEVARDEATVVLAVDVSASMTATDVEPDRLGAARAAAAEFVRDLPDAFQVGLVAFDGTARVLVSPTTEHDTVVAAIETLSAGQGTATGDGLEAALAAIEAAQTTTVSLTTDTDSSDADPTDADEAVPSTVVLLADGATTVGQPLETATQLAVEAGVPVTTIAYGTDSGTVTIDGQAIAVPADTDAMAEVADATGGSAFTAASADELAQVYDDIESRIGTTTEEREILRAFVGIAVVALLAAALTSMLWSARFL